MNVNVVYAQMTRGKTEKVAAMAIASLACTLSKMAMDICLYNSNDLGFVKFPDADDFKFVDANRYPVPANTQVRLNTGTGGGWGDPLDRDPALVAWDVLEGLVSVKAAAEAYGVVVSEKGVLDEAATAALRKQRRAKAA